MRPDLDIRPLRGNVDTRLRKLEGGEFDAIVLAVAGLRRLGLADRVTEALNPEEFVPAISQGALGVECRSEDTRTKTVLAELHSYDSALRVSAERGVMAAVGGDCKTPVGAYATRAGEQLDLLSFIASADLRAHARAAVRTAWPKSAESAFACGLALGAKLLGELALKRS
jgi:hydroxymethylbilane synthase